VGCSQQRTEWRPCSPLSATVPCDDVFLHSPANLPEILVHLGYRGAFLSGGAGVMDESSFQRRMVVLIVKSVVIPIPIHPAQNDSGHASWGRSIKRHWQVYHRSVRTSYTSEYLTPVNFLDESSGLGAAQVDYPCYYHTSVVGVEHAFLHQMNHKLWLLCRLMRACGILWSYLFFSSPSALHAHPRLTLTLRFSLQ
jgi:hypothetical protein